MKFSPALSLFLIALLPLTLGWKLTLRPDNPDEVNSSVVEFLTKNQFSAIVSVEKIDESHVVRATSADCKLFVAKVSPLRNAKDEIQYLASTTDRMFVVFRGEVYSEQPRLLTIANYFWFRLVGALGLVAQIPPLLAVVSSCDAAARLPWGELRLPD